MSPWLNQGGPSLEGCLYADVELQSQLLVLLGVDVGSGVCVKFRGELCMSTYVELFG